MGKSRVAPKKATTIPRLELTAATVAAKTSAMITEELGFPIDDLFFWTDSKICIGYINYEVKQFRIFVANRCQKIRSLSKRNNGTALNPVKIPLIWHLEV